MRIKIPLTGTLVTEDPDTGDPEDPVRVINLDLGDVAWQAVAFDWDAGLVEVELEVPRHTGRHDPDTGKAFPDEPPAKHATRRAAALSRVKSLLLDHTVDELYGMAGDPRLRRPFKK